MPYEWGDEEKPQPLRMPPGALNSGHAARHPGDDYQPDFVDYRKVPGYLERFDNDPGLKEHLDEVGNRQVRAKFWYNLRAKGVRWGTITTPPIKGKDFEEIWNKLIVETGGRTW